MRRFWWLWSGQLASVIGTGLTDFALGVWVYQRTGSATQYAMIFMLAVLPGIAAAPLAGVVADRFSRRTILLLCDAVGVACMTGLAVLYSAGILQVWQIYLTAAAGSVMVAFQIPAFAATVTTIVPRKDIDRANGLLTMVQAGQLLAPLLAGFLLTAVSLRGVIMADAISYLVNTSALLAARIPRARGTGDAQSSVLAQWLEGWRYVTSRPSFLGLLGFSAAVNLCIGFVDVLMTPIVLGFASAETLGIVLTIGGVGLAGGSVLRTAWGGPGRRVHGLIGFTIPLGLAMCLGALRPSIVLVTVATFVFLFCSAITNASVRSIWQVKVEPGLHGRVLALQNMVASASPAAAYALAGPIADHWFEPLLRRGGNLAGSVGTVMGTGPGRGMALLVLLLGVVVVAIAAGGYLLPSLRRMDELVPDIPDPALAGDPVGQLAADSARDAVR